MTASKNRDEAKEAVGRQIERLRAYCLYDGKDLEARIQKTPSTFFDQRDNSVQAWRTCNTSANAVYLSWLRDVTGRDALTTDEGYLSKVLSIGDTTVHQVQTDALKDYGWSTVWMTDHDYLFIEELEKAGIPVVCNIRHKGSNSNSYGGHIITIVGEDGDNFIIQDSWGDINKGYASGSNGRLVRLDKDSFKARWQSGYRILARA